MLIEGSISSNKTQILAEEYARLINSGVSSADILVLVNNSSAKERFSKKVFELLEVDSVEKMQIYSFFGLVYNTIIDNWAFLSPGSAGPRSWSAGCSAGRVGMA